MNDNLVLSIVIPVYNCEKYLDTLLTSCVTQNVEKVQYEIICVDDGSEDNSLRILKKYAAKYSNIHVYGIKRRGVAAARNLGMEKAVGDYIWFVDADDYIQHDIFQELFVLLYQCKSQKINFSYYWIEDNFNNQFPQKKIVLIKKDRDIGFNNPYCWSYIFERKLLEEHEELRFVTDCIYGEDEIFTIYLDYYAENQSVIENQFYYYRQRRNSVSRTYFCNDINKYIYSRVKLAESNRYNLENHIYDDKFINMIRERIVYDLRGVISLGLVYKNNDDFRKLLLYLKSKKLYPYKSLRYRKKERLSLNKIVINAISILYPYERLLLLIKHIISMFGRGMK